MLAKFFIGFKDPLGFYKTMKDGYTTLEKAKESEKNKSNINEIVKGTDKSEEQKVAMKNIKALYKSWEKVIKLFNDYSKNVFEAKYKIKYEEGLKTLTPKQGVQRLPIVPAQVKTSNTSKDLINEIRQI